jgi:hypothetical protein
MTDRDPTLLRSFITLRVINPERRDWRCGYHAARRRHATHGHLRVLLETIDYDAETRNVVTGRAVGRRPAPGPRRRPLATRRNPDLWRERWAQPAAIDPDWNPAGRDDPAKRWSPGLAADAHGRAPAHRSWRPRRRPGPGHTVGGEDVGAWLQRQRRGGQSLTPAQRAVLAEIGVDVTGQAEQPATATAAAVRGGLVDAHPRRGRCVPGAGGASDGAAQTRRGRRRRARLPAGTARRSQGWRNAFAHARDTPGFTGLIAPVYARWAVSVREDIASEGSARHARMTVGIRGGRDG